MLKLKKNCFLPFDAFIFGCIIYAGGNSSIEQFGRFPYGGIPQNDVGLRTDVIENISKSKGMKMLIRSMAPEVIACDEIGSKEDVEAIRRGYCSRGQRDIYYAWKDNGRC